MSFAGDDLDNLVFNSYLEWISVSNKIFNKCDGEINLNCINEQIKVSKDSFERKFMHYDLINQLERSGQIEEAKILLTNELDDISSEHIDYFDYRFLDLGLSKFVYWGEYDKAETCLHTIIDFFDTVECDSIFDVFTTYRKGGELYLIYLELPLQSEDYFEKSLDYWMNNIQDSIWLPPLLYDLAVVKNENQELEIAEEYLQEAIHIANSYPKKYGKRFLGKCQSLMAIIFNMSHRNEEAIGLYSKIIENKENVDTPNYDELILDYLNVIAWQIINSDYSLAEDYVQRAEKIYNKTTQKEQRLLITILLARLEINIANKRIKEAYAELTRTKNLIENLDYNLQSSLLYDLGIVESKLLKAEDKVLEAFNLLDNLGSYSNEEVFTYLSNNISRQINYYSLIGDLKSELIDIGQHDIQSKRSAIYYYSKADSIINQLRVRNAWRNSSVYLVEHYRLLTGKLLNEYYKLYELSKDEEIMSKVFNLLERNQALLINERVKQQSRRSQIGNNVTNYNEVKKLIAEIELIERELLISGSPSDKIKLDQLNRKYYKSISILDSSYHRYDLIGFDDWKNKLKITNTDWIEYFVADSNIYFLFSSDNSLGFDRIDFSQNLKDNLGIVIDNLRDHESDNFSLFSTAAYNLCMTLIPKSIRENNKNDIIIIQDDIFYFLPFDVLLTTINKNSNYANADYLLRHKNIRYSLSSSLWKTANIKINESILFAVYNDKISELKEANREVKMIKKLWPSSCKIVDTKASFLENIAKSKIIHVAAHATADTANLSNNMLFFCNPNNSNCVLKGYELSASSLNDKLVVLNGCETNYGKVVKGEGVFSLVRDFAVNGTLSFVSNLWKVSDGSASTIMINTYTNWKKDKKLSSSLQKAKLDYIKSSHSLTTHPFYWANTIVIGDAELESPNTFFGKIKWMSYSIIFIFILFLIGSILVHKN